MSAILEIFGVLVVAILGFLGLMKIVYSMRAGRKIWDFYKEQAKELGLDLREGHGGNYGMPDLYGEKDDRRMYVHPVKGKKKKPPKTVYAVETGIKLDEKVIITSPETSEIEEDLPTLDLSYLKKYDLDVAIESQMDKSLAKSLISKKVAGELNKLLQKNSDSFRGLIFESGLVMFTTYGIDLDKVLLNQNLDAMVKIVGHMENNVEKDLQSLRNERLEAIEKKSRLVYMEFGFMSIIFILGLYLAYTSVYALSFFYINLGIVVAMISGARVFSILNTRGWLRNK